MSSKYHRSWLGSVALYVATFPQDIVALLLILLFYVFSGKEFIWDRGCLWCVLKEDSWFVRRIYYKWGGTTFGGRP